MVDVRYDIAFKLYPYQKGADQDFALRRHPVVIVGGGPIGMALALDLGRKGTPVLVLDDHEGVGQGSRAICFAKRTLEICDRLGAGKAMIDKGVQWNVGKVFHGDERVFEFNLQPEDGHKAPAFINLQQPYFEKYLVDEIRVAQSDGAPIEIRGRNAVTRVTPQGDHVVLVLAGYGVPVSSFCHIVAAATPAFICCHRRPRRARPSRAPKRPLSSRGHR